MDESQLTHVLGIEGVRQLVLGALSPLTLLRLRRVCRSAGEWVENALQMDCVPRLVLVGGSCATAEASTVLSRVRQRSLARALLLGEDGSEEDEDGDDGDLGSEDEYSSEDEEDEDDEGDSDEADSDAESVGSHSNGEEEGCAPTSKTAGKAGKPGSLVFSLDWLTGIWHPESSLASGVQAPVCSQPDSGSIDGGPAFVLDGVCGALQQVSLANSSDSSTSAGNSALLPSCRHDITAGCRSER